MGGSSNSSSEAALHRHEHSSAQQSNDDVLRRLYLASGLCVTFLLVEVVGGYLSGSLAVLSDAAHLLSDLAAFLVAIGASHLAARPASDQHTFGLKRMESLAALMSMVSLALVSVALALEAVRRMYGMLQQGDEGEEGGEAPVDGSLMSGIAAIGVAVNVALAAVLGPENHVHMPGASHDHSHDHADHCDEGHNHSHNHHQDDSAAANHTTSSSHDHSHGHATHYDDNGSTEQTSLIHQHHHVDELDPMNIDMEEEEQQQLLPVETKMKSERNINLQAAYLHVLGDLLQSVAVLIAGLVIWIKPSWHLVDPLITLVFCGIVFYSTLGVIRSSVSILLEEVPPHISWQQVFTAISQVPNICRVHDLHIWSISHGVPSLSVHCFLVSSSSGTTSTLPAPDPQQALRDVQAVCERFGILHATIQIQCGDENAECITCPSADDSGQPHSCVPSNH